MKEVGIAVVGLGIIGERLIGTILKHPNYKIIGGFDLDESRSKYISDKFGLHIFDSFQEIIESKDVEAVYLAVPPAFHEQLAIQIMKSGKHLLCEKPLANSIEEAERLYLEANKHKIITAMNFPLPYTSAYKVLSDSIRLNELGEIRRIEIKGRFPSWPRSWQVNQWIDTKDQGGFTREVFTHLVQVIVSLFGDIQIEFKTVAYPDQDGKSEIDLLAYGKTADGIKVSIDGLARIGQKESLTLTIFGEEKVMELSNWRQLSSLSKTQDHETLPLESTDASYELIDAFYSRINGSNSKLVDFESGYKTARIVENLLG